MNEEDAEVDLSSLENFSLSPDWSSSKKPNFPQRNERFLGPKNKDSRNRPKGGQPRKKANYVKRNTDFDLGWSFSIIPDVKILQTIKLKLKETGITYSLREITDVIASKNERLMVKIASKNPENQIWKSKTSDSYFISRESAVNNFFSEEKTFIECKLIEEVMPKGNFMYIFQCPITKELLPPTSFHGFEDVVRHHIYSNRIKSTHKKFIDSLQKIEDKEKIDLWAKSPIKRYSYLLKIEENKEFQSIEALKLAIEKEFFSNFFISKNSLTIAANNLSIIESPLRAQIESFISDKRKWLKDLFTSCLVSLKRSKYCIFKKGEIIYVRQANRKSIENFETKKLTSEIIAIISSDSKVSKKSLSTKLQQKGFDLKELVLELKWLVKEGYINEYSDSSLELN
ncbi:MAG: hypothetical protein ACJZ5X_05285 [Opitutales bacterium]